MRETYTGLGIDTSTQPHDKTLTVELRAQSRVRSELQKPERENEQDRNRERIVVHAKNERKERHNLAFKVVGLVKQPEGQREGIGDV